MKIPCLQLLIFFQTFFLFGNLQSPPSVDCVKKRVVIDKEGTEFSTVRFILIKGGVKMSYNHRY